MFAVVFVYGDRLDDTSEEKPSIFSPIRIH